MEAFKMLKKVRESRVKSFKTYEEAERFSKCGLESPTEIETPIIISAEINGIHSNNTNNNVNCDKSSSKGMRMLHVFEIPPIFHFYSNLTHDLVRNIFQLLRWSVKRHHRSVAQRVKNW